MLDSLGSCESIYNMYTSNPKNWEKHELNHFKDNWYTILDLFSSLTCDNKMARENENTELLMFYFKLVHFIRYMHNHQVA